MKSIIFTHRKYTLTAGVTISKKKFKVAGFQVHVNTGVSYQIYPKVSACNAKGDYKTLKATSQTPPASISMFKFMD